MATQVLHRVRPELAHILDAKAFEARMDGFVFIEHGPGGLRILAVCGTLISCMNSASFLTGRLSPFVGSLHHPGAIGYLVAIYQVFFAATAMLFEAQDECIVASRILNSYQDLLLEHSRFLAKALGRSFFYWFQGSLWLMFASPVALRHLVVGGWLILLSLLHLSVHFGHMPRSLVAKRTQQNQSIRPMQMVEAKAPTRREETDSEAPEVPYEYTAMSLEEYCSSEPTIESEPAPRQGHPSNPRCCCVQ